MQKTVTKRCNISVQSIFIITVDKTSRPTIDPWTLWLIAILYNAIKRKSTDLIVELYGNDNSLAFTTHEYKAYHLIAQKRIIYVCDNAKVS